MASRGQSQGPDAGPNSQSAGSPPPRLARLARLAPPRHHIGHLEVHLAGQRRVTWWWVSPISLVSPSSPPTPPGPHSRVATRKLPLLRGGGLPGRILASGTTLLVPRVPFLLTPTCHAPPHNPCHPPPPCRHPPPPRHRRPPRHPRRTLCPPPARPPGGGPPPSPG